MSSEATLGTGTGIGDSIELRFGDGTQHEVTIAAIYRNGLGFGGFII